jgi:hypothetical protein
MTEATTGYHGSPEASISLLTIYQHQLACNHERILTGLSTICSPETDNKLQSLLDPEGPLPFHNRMASCSEFFSSMEKTSHGRWMRGHLGVRMNNI